MSAEQDQKTKKLPDQNGERARLGRCQRRPRRWLGGRGQDIVPVTSAARDVRREGAPNCGRGARAPLILAMLAALYFELRQRVHEGGADQGRFFIIELFRQA